ncbi:phosphoesterase [Lipomyces orientalis]|uniref:Phosphoesterase n=1 Tax=Lipomyces orientalis TaxID=1233043 RepID=A0ACC3TMZ7_9ASCO
MYLGATTILALLAVGANAFATSWKDKIKTVVVLVQENRSFDTFAGGLVYNSTINGLAHHRYCNPANVTDPYSEIVCAKPIAANVAPDDPNHGISGVNMEILGTYHPNEVLVDTGKERETMLGFVTEQSSTYKTENLTRAAEAINYYTQSHIPVFAAMAENFVLFDRWFAAVPGPTNPNRAYLTSGTSYGHGRNDHAFNIAGLPQRSIFQQLSEKGIEWINYQNSTKNPMPNPSSGFNPDALFYNWTFTSGKWETNIKPIADFYSDAEAGKLPPFTYINPECCSYDSYHPPSPISTGEGFIKSIYEALRGSPQWEETLFILTFDEHGGFGDHVRPPVGVPAGDDLTYTETAPDGKNMTFNFERLGIRVPTVVISPWVEKGVIESKGINNGLEYTHTSIPEFIAKLWDLDSLTPRTAWSSTFEHLITNKMRRDTPDTLPEPVSW